MHGNFNDDKGNRFNELKFRFTTSVFRYFSDKKRKKMLGNNYAFNISLN